MMIIFQLYISGPENRVARLTYLVHSSSRVVPSPAVVCSPPCLLSKTGRTHRQQAHKFRREASELSRSAHSNSAPPPDRHFFKGILERRSSFGNILELYWNWTNNLHNLLCCPSERLLTSFGCPVPNSIMYTFHQSPYSALGLQRPLGEDVLLFFSPYRVDSADVFMFADYLQTQNLTQIFKPLSQTQMLVWQLA
jgi:hypothetical protein